MYSKALVFVSCEAGVPCSVWEVPYLVCLSDVMLTNDSAESQLVPCIRLQKLFCVVLCGGVYDRIAALSNYVVVVIFIYVVVVVII